ncbi:MAG: Hsp70 family protein [Lachnospiraceae bacterium]|nr:Hsp70 family protein [Lachnospiraceae bacterium]
MAYNIGLDFGTTYSVISRLKEKYDNQGNLISREPEACIPSEAAHSPCQDSIVLRQADNSLLFGLLARDKTGRRGTTTYKGFKMMLAENDRAKLTARGYDSEFTPKRVVAEYLNNILQNHLSMYNTEDNRINKLVVGVPEIWFSDIATIDCRVTLEETLAAFPFVDSVELVSEPAAACAFFVDNYKRNTGKDFNGRILLVDYGGGTLDIALCDVEQQASNSQVSVLRRSGAGLNEEGFIGKAGMAFIEAVVKIALRPVGISDEELIRHRDFYRCVHSVETALMNQMRDIQDAFDFAELSDRSEIDDTFYEIEFDRDEYVVTFGMLAQAYQQVIYHVLDEKLDEMIAYMNKHNIRYQVDGDDNFKIAMVGGFCNFFLTQEQVEQKFKKATNDRRFSDIINDRRDCEKAISYGAALIANQITSFKQLAPYHLGIATGSKDEPREFYYAIHKGDEVVYDEPIFIKNKFGEDILFAASAIPLLAFSLDDDMNYAQWGEALEKYKSKLTLTKNKLYKIGFSLDRSMRITIHKHVIESPRHPNNVVDSSSVRLNDDIYSILGSITEVRRVK